MPLINKPFEEPAWSLPAGVVDVENETFQHPIERYKHEPDEATEDCLIYDQVKNRLFLALKLVGEQVAFYRQKQAGELCSCVDKNRQSAVSTCPVCHGTRFVGGYEYMGKALVQFPQVARTKIITELGLKLQEQNNPWTLNKPLLRERDFLVRKMMLPLSNQLREVEEPVIRGNYSADEDILQHINLLNIYKLSNLKQADGSDYVEGTDYILAGGEMVLEESGNAPAPDTRVLKVVGKKSPITGNNSTNPVPVNAGLSNATVGKVINAKAWSGEKDKTLADGIGADTGFFTVTISQVGIHDTGVYPLSSFSIIIGGDRIIWLTGGSKPTSGATYYVTYDYVQTFTERYHIKTVSPVAPQGAIILQSFEIAILEPTHPVYGVGSPFDNGSMIDYRNGVTKEMVQQLYGQFGLASGNETDPKFNQEAGYY